MNEHTHKNCQELLGSLSSYIDGDLPPELCDELEKHLAGCDDCRVVLNTTKRTLESGNCEGYKKYVTLN